MLNSVGFRPVTPVVFKGIGRKVCDLPKVRTVEGGLTAASVYENTEKKGWNVVCVGDKPELACKIHSHDIEVSVCDERGNPARQGRSNLDQDDVAEKIKNDLKHFSSIPNKK